MPLALLLITIGGAMIYSALHGITIADAFKGVTGDTLDPKGGGQDFQGGSAGDFSAGGVTAGNATGDLPHGSTPVNNLISTLAGPHRDLLMMLANAAVNNYHLTITDVCRSPSHNKSVGGASGSMHLACRAFDATGKVSDRVAFARWVVNNYGSKIAECYCDQAGITWKNGHNYFPALFDNATMVHVSA